MTIKDYCAYYGVSRRSVVQWLKQGYLPGSKRHEQMELSAIPASTRPPYTKARARYNITSIYASFVRACQSNRAILAPLYKMPSDSFAIYVQHAIAAGLIEPYTTAEGVVQYIHTIEGEAFVQMKDAQRTDFLKSLVRHGVRGAAEGLAGRPGE